jgi:thiamine pyrophosphokinase
MKFKPNFAVRRFDSLDEMKAEEYRYWQSQPDYARLQAVTDITRAAFALQDQAIIGRRLQRTLSRVRR